MPKTRSANAQTEGRECSPPLPPATDSVSSGATFCRKMSESTAQLSLSCEGFRQASSRESKSSLASLYPVGNHRFVRFYPSASDLDYCAPDTSRFLARVHPHRQVSSGSTFKGTWRTVRKSTRPAIPALLESKHARQSVHLLSGSHFDLTLYSPAEFAKVHATLEA